MPKKKIIKSNMPTGEWCWPLPYRNRVFTDAFLDDWLGVNPKVSKENRHEFMVYLSKSLSLSTDMKKRIVAEYANLSEWQFSEINKVFREEQEKFMDLEREHPSDILRLTGKVNLEWAILLDEKNGAKVFYELFFNKENFFLSREIEEILDRLHDFNQLDVLYVLCDKFVYERFSENKYLDYDFFNIVNLYLYASAYLGFLRKDHESYQIGLNSIIGIENKNQRDFLNFCFFEYHTRLMGFNALQHDVADRFFSSQNEDLLCHSGYLFYIGRISFFIKKQYSEWIFYFAKSIAASFGFLNKKNRRNISYLDKSEIFRIIYFVEHLDLYLKDGKSEDKDNRIINFRGFLIGKLTSLDLKNRLDGMDSYYDKDYAVISIKIYALAKNMPVPESVYRLKNKNKNLEFLYFLMVEKIDIYNVLSVLDGVLLEAKEKMDMIQVIQELITYILYTDKSKGMEKEEVLNEKKELLNLIGAIFSKNTKSKKLYDETDSSIAIEYAEYLVYQIKTGVAFDDRSRELMHELLMQQDETEKQ